MRSVFHHPIVRKHARQGLKFVISGLTGASIEFSILVLLVEVFDVSPHIAYIPSGLAAVTFVFFFNKYVTFVSKGDSAAQTMRFIAVYSVAFLLNYLVASGVYTLALIILEPDSFLYDKAYLFAKAFAIGVIAVINYTLSHGFIFRQKREVVEMPL